MPYATNKDTDQSDQRLCHLLPRWYKASSFYIQNFKPQSSVCSCADRLVPYLVGNPQRQVFLWRGSYQKTGVQASHFFSTSSLYYWNLNIIIPIYKLKWYTQYAPCWNKVKKWPIRPKLNWARARQNQQNDVCSAKTQISLGIHPVWSVFTDCTKKSGSLATQWVHSKDWLDMADAQADLELSWVHRSICCSGWVYIIP